MEVRASANIKRDYKKGFSIIEVFVSLIILAIIGLALVDTVILFLQLRLINSIDNHMVDAAQNLATVPDKVKSCTTNSNPCAVFGTADCASSVSCNRTYCSDNNTCVACYVNPQNGKAFYYGFNATLISNGSATGLDYDVYRITMCRSYVGKTKEKSFVIHIRR